ncbi:MAG: F-type H+-transporting ATPase subunit gamma [Alphaproteobacteria bacterium]|jgi:F-type H+-transporting ATPase subunit gamma
MPSLKDLRARIVSVQNTQKITKTMKMVAAAKVRRARMRCEAARPYAEKLNGVLVNLATNTPTEGGPLLLSGHASVKTVRLVIISADRGLCGGFNGNLVKRVVEKIHALQLAGKKVELVMVGKKAFDLVKHEFAENVIDNLADTGKNVSYSLAEEIGAKLISDYETGKCQEIILFYNRFVNMMTQEPMMQYLAPFKVDIMADKETEIASAVEYEPEEEAILSVLLPRNINVQLLNAMLESGAAEHAARMTAMESATTNAGDMISKLSLQYNRTRQAAITTELTEIVAGAEAV